MAKQSKIDPNCTLEDFDGKKPQGFLADVRWAYDNMVLSDVTQRDAPTTGAWLMLQLARMDASVLNPGLMLMAKQEEGSATEARIQRECLKREKDIRGLVAKIRETAI